MTAGGVALRPFTPDLPGFEELTALSMKEEHRMLLRLAENWANASNWFAKTGELINGAFDGKRLIGVGGRNVDPYHDDDRTARVRHVYVHPHYRRRGVGRLLMAPIMADPDARFDVINCRAPSEAFTFYETLGFAPVLGDDLVTHRLNLHLERNAAR